MAWAFAVKTLEGKVVGGWVFDAKARVRGLEPAHGPAACAGTRGRRGLPRHHGTLVLLRGVALWCSGWTTVLPESLWNERIKVPAVRIKLCIDHQGKVVRSVLLNSSGNTKVNHYYLVEWSKATFKPIERNRKPVPSVFTVSTRWNPR